MLKVFCYSSAFKEKANKQAHLLNVSVTENIRDEVNFFVYVFSIDL